MDGFPQDGAVLSPPVEILPATRDLLERVMCAVAMMHTPEEIRGWVEHGFPKSIETALRRPLEREEMSAHADVVLSVLQAPTLAVA